VRDLGVGAGRAGRGSILLVLGALLIATDVADQNPRPLENNGGHFREPAAGNFIRRKWKRSGDGTVGSVDCG